jgi:hypothetical protein
VLPCLLQGVALCPFSQHIEFLRKITIGKIVGCCASYRCLLLVNGGFQESGRGKTGGVKYGEGRNPVTLHQENDPAIAGDDLGERAGESVENTAVGDL